MALLLDLFYLVLLGLLSPVVLYKMATREKYRAGIQERLGLDTLPPPRPSGGSGDDRPVVWIHGVSVGEVLASRPLVEALVASRPDLDIVVSSTTNTGHQVAAKTFPDHRIIYYPLDFSFSVRTVVDRVRPDAIILMELEIWPNFLECVWDRGIPVVLVNGRISEHSFRGYVWIRWLLFRPLRKIRRFCVQTDTYADRFRKLGVPSDQIVVTGNMKYDHDLPDPDELGPAVREELGIARDAPVLFAGSTHHPEERRLLEVYGRLREEWPDLRLVLVPRHPERLADVVAAIRDAGFPLVRKTAIDEEGPPSGGEPVILIDTMGELARLYAAGTVVFVGGSLIPHGGQNMLEPAGLGRAILLGPHTFNFEATVDLLERNDACVRVEDADALEAACRDLLGHEEKRETLGRRAREAVARNVGATERTMDEILAVLDRAGV